MSVICKVSMMGKKRIKQNLSLNKNSELIFINYIIDQNYKSYHLRSEEET